MAVSVWDRAGVPWGGECSVPAGPRPLFRPPLASRARPGSGAVRPRRKFRAGRGGCRYRPGHGEAAPLPGRDCHRDGARGSRRTSDGAVGSGEEGGCQRRGSHPQSRSGSWEGVGRREGSGLLQTPFHGAALLWGGAIPTWAPGFSTPGSASPVHLLGGITG